MTKSLAGLRVLIVEDEMLVAMTVEDALTDLGCQIVGPAESVEKALLLLESADLDLALLDINLNGHMSYPVADALLAAGIPFAFVSGYGQVTEGYRHLPMLAKPYRPQALETALLRLSGVQAS